MIVDVGKYTNLTKDAQDLLYRPPRVRTLYEKYWQLFEVITNKEKEKENDRDIL